MASAKFKLHSVTIEGFRGFTDEQNITFSGKHGFLFGKNGCGKSSIVEAIRWCLFGLADRPETEVHNAYYPPGDCQVSLQLQATDGLWRFQRRFRPGAERSRLTIYDPDGNEVALRQVFPYLARMGPTGGTHIIFAAQHESGHRPKADITDFNKVLYSYLNLEDVPELIDRLDKILEEYRDKRESLASDIEDTKESIREELIKNKSKLEELLRDPPWGEETTPTKSETHEKVQRFSENIASLTNNSLIEDLLPNEKLECSEKWIQEFASSKKSELEKKLEEQRGKLEELIELVKNVREMDEKIESYEGSNKKLKEKLGSIFPGKSIDEIEVELNETDISIKEKTIRLMIAKDAEAYCSDNKAVECPVCQAKYTAEGLLSRVKDVISQIKPVEKDLMEEAEKLRDRYNNAMDLKKEMIVNQEKLNTLREEWKEAISRIKSLLGIINESTLYEEELHVRQETLADNIKSLETSIETDESRYTTWKRQIDNLKKELRFHRYRREEQKLENQLTLSFESIESYLREVSELDSTVCEIKDRLASGLGEAIDLAIPHLNKMMTEVYRRLTGQQSFENVLITRAVGSGVQELKVKIGSEHFPEQLFDPEDVLNGQAQSALRLVPYFVFSQFKEEALELDLLLIDDPSQSFDTSHIELLLQELATAGSHAQLIVATHEDERFEPLLDEYFCDPFMLIKFNEFDPVKGPAFVNT